MALSASEKQRAYRERRKGMAEVTAGEADLAAEKVALADVKPCSSRVEAARARLQVEATFRKAIEAAKAAHASGVLPEAGHVWFRARVSMMWDEVRERLKAGDPE